MSDILSVYKRARRTVASTETRAQWECCKKYVSLSIRRLTEMRERAKEFGCSESLIQSINHKIWDLQVELREKKNTLDSL